MPQEKKRAGDREALQVRRIGHRHAVVTPARTTEVVDINKMRNQLQQAEANVTSCEAALARAVEQRDSMLRFLAAFDAQSIDRIDGDPSVPLDEPLPDDVKR